MIASLTLIFSIVGTLVGAAVFFYRNHPERFTERFYFLLGAAFVLTVLSIPATVVFAPDAPDGTKTALAVYALSSLFTLLLLPLVAPVTNFLLGSPKSMEPTEEQGSANSVPEPEVSSSQNTVDVQENANDNAELTVNVLLLGDEYAGKTQLIRGLSANWQPVPVLERTEAPHCVYLDENGLVFRFHDIRGQGFAGLQPYLDSSELGADFVHVVVIVVDLTALPERRDEHDDKEYEKLLEEDRGSIFDAVDKGRIERQVQTRLGSGFMDLFVPKLKSPGRGEGTYGVALFLNKADKIKGFGEDVSSSDLRGIDLISDYEKSLREYFEASTKVLTFVGSALTGVGVIDHDGLKSFLYEVRDAVDGDLRRG